MILHKEKTHFLPFCFALAIVLHVLLIVALYPRSVSSNAGGETKQQTVNTYFYPLQAKGKAGNQLKNLTPTQHTKTVIEKGQRAQAETNNPESIAAAQHTQHYGHSQLLTALHNAIQAKQLYPSTALFMQQSGTAIVHFRLLPNGTIQNSRILKSSGYKILDNAALNAVAAISPFHTPPTTKPQTFKVAVSFAINNGNTL